MIKNKIVKKIVDLWPHAVVLLCFAVLSFIYFSPVLKGKELPQMDNIHGIGAAHELTEYAMQSGEQGQWTDAMFGGMPAYQIMADNSSNIFLHLSQAIRLGLPYTTVGIVFLYLVGFYVLMLSMGANRWVSVIGAVAFALGSYNIIIIAAGHITKCYAIAMMPMVIGGVLMIFRGKWVVGGVFTTVALGLELAFNHVQITYYLALALLLLVVAKLVQAIMDRKHQPNSFKRFGQNIAVLAAASLLAILPSTVNLWTTWEYGKYSIRGASELKAAPGEKEHDGLDKEYALGWSYGVHETPTLLIPNVVGGASEAIGDNKALKDFAPEIRQAVAGQSSYWGGRSFTSGPVYVGAIVCFLFFIGCFYYEGRLKWWLIAATVMSIVLAWGKNMPFITDLMFYYFPLYNKFRTVEMALVIATVTVPLLGMLGLKAILEHPEDIRYHPGKFLGSLGLTAGVCLIFAAVPSLFYNFLTDMEAEQLGALTAQNAIYGQLEDALVAARTELLRSDAMRSAVLIMLASSALWFFAVGKINHKIMLGTVALLVLFDLWAVDRRYLSSDNFVSKSDNRNFVLSQADKLILDDQDPHRVMALYCNPFNEVYTSYYHHSIGGYHGAKLRRYQDVIDYYLTPEWQTLVGVLRAQNYAGIDSALAHSPALNMLNCRYFIYNPQQSPIVNHYAQPAAWFVSQTVGAASPDEAIEFIGQADLSKSAIVELQNGEDTNTSPTSLANVTFDTDSAATINQTLYTPNKVTYESQSAADGFAVFSEICYEAGWKVTIDGEPANIVRTNYILRGLSIPAGHHTIEFTFAPTSYYAGRIIAWIASAVVVILIILTIVYAARQQPAEVEVEKVVKGKK